jgi:hypothetical protein
MDDDLRQADLSKLAIKEMSSAQRAELKRRFEDFVEAFTKRPPNERVTKAPKVRKWVPGMKS